MVKTRRQNAIERAAASAVTSVNQTSMNLAGDGNASPTAIDDDANLISGGILVVVITFFVAIFSFYTYNRLTHDLMLGNNNSTLRWLLSWSTFKAIMARIISLSIVALSIFIIYQCIRFYVRRRHQEREQVYDLVDKTIELLQSPDTPRVMPVLHIRDTLMSPCERRTKRMSRLWAKCVRFIEENESRVKVELVNIDGEDFRAWKWVGSAPGAGPNCSFNVSRHDLNKTGNTTINRGAHSSFLDASISPNDRNVADDNRQQDDNRGTSERNPNQNLPIKTGEIEWQGSAFDEEDETRQNNHVYERMSTRTQYIKIRNMFDQKTRMTYPNSWKANVRGAILEKITKLSKDGQHGITHMVIDETSTEGVVFAKCNSDTAARQAYCSLHGWWCEKKLVSVKFLKPERYYQRFPEARLCTVPLKLQKS